MPNRLEDRIRDFLVDNLELLEKGLRLYKKEMVLENPHGAGGKVDIVARDNLGNWVIIEIKRSNQAARAALHELHKYTALFLSQHGLDEVRVRIMIASTEWHELRVPFSEFSEASSYSTDGIKISWDEKNGITEVSRVSKITRSAALEFSQEQQLFLFADKEQRTAGIEILVSAINDSAIKDSILLTCDYKGGNPRVIHPFGICWVFVSPLHRLSAADRKKAIDELENEDPTDEDSPEADTPFMLPVISRLVGKCDEMEICYPEKLGSISAEWALSLVYRSGRCSNPIWEDEELLKMARLIEGGGTTWISKSSSPKLKAAWAKLIEDTERVTTGNENWHSILPAWLREVAETMPNAMVTLSLYVPNHLLFSLRELAKPVTQPAALFPRFEAIVTDEESQTQCGLLGFIVWNGKKPKFKGKQMVDKIFGPNDAWMWAVQFHRQWEYEEKAMKLHDLFTPIMEFSIRKGGNEKSIYWVQQTQN